MGKNKEKGRRINELQKKVKSHQKVILGQTAMISFLASLLVKKGVLNPLEARMVVMAGIEAQEFEGLEAGDIQAWAQENLKSMLKKAATSGEG